MKPNQTHRSKIWEMYSNGSTKEQIQKETSATIGYIETIISQFKVAERKIAKDKERKFYYGDDDYTAYLMTNKVKQTEFYLHTVNPIVETLIRKLNL